MPDTLTATAPEHIWLQIDTYGDPNNRSTPFPQDGDVTWCRDSVGGVEVEYVRADLASAAQPAVPPGWRLVPEKPTDEWISALSDSGMRIGSLQSAIRDMLAAAPKAAPARWYMVNAVGMATLCADRQDAEQAAADVQAALRTARAFIKWRAFGECRADGWEGPPPTAAEAVAAIESVLNLKSAVRAAAWARQQRESRNDR